MEQIKWGIIGCGEVTEVKSGPAFYKSENSALAAVMRRDGKKAEDYAKRHNVPKWYDDADKLINDPDVDIVYIATPPVNHDEYAIKTLNAGKPVYIEKPMALDYSKCQKILETAKANSLPVFTAYYRRCLPYFLKIKELIDSEIIGKILFVKLELMQPPAPNEMNSKNPHWHVIPEISGGGRFVDMACHQLDFLDYVLGPVISAKGEASNLKGLYPAEDTVSASFKFKSGLIGSGTWSFVAPEDSNSDKMIFIGDKGEIIASAFSNTPIKVISDNKETEYNVGQPDHVQQPLIEKIINELNNSGTCPSTGISGARTTQVIDWILNDWRHN